MPTALAMNFQPLVPTWDAWSTGIIPKKRGIAPAMVPDSTRWAKCSMVLRLPTCRPGTRKKWPKINRRFLFCNPNRTGPGDFVVGLDDAGIIISGSFRQRIGFPVQVHFGLVQGLLFT